MTGSIDATPIQVSSQVAYVLARKRRRHPDIGRISPDCDALLVAGDDLRILIYTAEPGTDDAERLALAVVLGTQS